MTKAEAAVVQGKSEEDRQWDDDKLTLTFECGGEEQALRAKASMSSRTEYFAERR